MIGPVPHALEPMVPGELGGRTVLDSSTHPPIVSNLEFMLDRSDPDDLIESFPVYLVTEALAERLLRAALTGFTLGDVTIHRSDAFTELYGHARHPSFRRLIVSGTAADDCWIGEDLRLCVSDRMLAILQAGRLTDCDVEEL